MKKYAGAGLAGIALCTALFASMALAGSGETVTVRVNGQPLQSDVPPQIVENRVMVPLRSLAEALGATVAWDSKQRVAVVTLPQNGQTASLEQRVQLLEAAVAPQTPEAAAETWAKAVQTRNGALEYAVLSPELKEAKRASFEELHWVTGTSSPWVERYRITPGETLADGSRTFQVQLDYRTSTNINDPVDWNQIPSVTVTVQQYDGVWLISKLQEE